MSSLNEGSQNYSSNELEKLAELVSKQSNRSSVSTGLVKTMLNIAQSSSSVDDFISSCSTFGKFDSKFLDDFYYKRLKIDGKDNGSMKLKSEQSEGRPEASEVKIQVKIEAEDLQPKAKKSLFKRKIKRPIVKYEEDETESFAPDKKQVVKTEDEIKTEPVEPRSVNAVNSSKRSRIDDLSSLSESAKEKLAKIRRERADKDAVEMRRSHSPPAQRTRQEPDRSIIKPLDQSVHVADPESEKFLDREWYTSEEFNGTAGDAEHNQFYDNSYDAEGEERLQNKLRTRISARAAQRKKESDSWERNQMKTSGLSNNSSAADLETDDGPRTHLILHNISPPFLDGKQIFTRQKDPVSAVKDVQSDLAQAGKRGSLLVRERRKQRERQKKAKEASSLAGTSLGNVLGVKSDDAEDSASSDRGKNSKTNQAQNSANSEFSRSKSLKEQRQYLPAFAVREQLLQVIRDNQVVVVIGETGSGKTTQLTQFLYEEGYGNRGMIGCTQPRRVAAMSVAKRVSEEMGVKLGQEVGYSIRFEDFTSSKTVIKYMTEGILLRESLMDSSLENYSCIIMDEAHERALNTDVLMGLFKNILVKRKDIKLIVTSATLNAERFSRFYGGAPQFTIPGRTFPVEVLNSQAPVADYVDAAVRQVLSIHLQYGPGDILVFMTGQEDIDATCDVLREKLELLDDPEPLEILPIYSQMPADLQAKIFEPTAKGTRKVVVATNIAETSLTVDGISYVVDSGFAKLKVYNPKMGMDSLQVVPISRANANQRSGRAGRTGKGMAFRLYTERSETEEMYEQTIPEIQRTNLSNTLLLLKSLGINDLLSFDFMDPPPSETITASLYDLWALGAIDNLGNLTPIGTKMASFPMDPSLSKLVIMSIDYGCTEEMLTIVSMLSVPTVFYRPKERQDESDAAREKFFVPESDHLTLLHVYNLWRNNGYSDAWCVKHFLHPRSLARAREVRDQLLSILEGNKRIAVSSCRGNWDVIRKCICSGYFHQAAKVKGLTDYVNVRTSVTMQLHPTSALYGLGYLPEYVVYHELVLTSKQFMSCVTAVDPYWLSEFGAVFYDVQERDRDGQIIRKNNNHDLVKKQIEKDRLLYLKMMEEGKAGDTNVKKIQNAVVLPGSRLNRRFRGI